MPQWHRGFYGCSIAVVLGVSLGLASCADRDVGEGEGAGTGAYVTEGKGAVPPEGQRRAFTSSAGGAGRRIQVNGFLWRAALDTITFMPINTADPYGGVIVTDWYSPPETPRERLKVNVLVQGAALRSDGVKVTIFRQKRGDGGWVDAAVDSNTAVDLENVILERARDMRQRAAN